MERKLYVEVMTLYINGEAVESDYRNTQYGEPKVEKFPIDSIDSLHNIAIYCGKLYFAVKFYKNPRKIKVGGVIYSEDSIKDMYLQNEYMEIDENKLTLTDIMSRLSVPEFINFCKDRGLGQAILE